MVESCRKTLSIAGDIHDDTLQGMIAVQMRLQLLARGVESAPQRHELLLIDLAVPRDIDSASAGLAGVSLYDIDDLQAVIARNRRVRQAEARKAEGIIEEEIQHFATWLGSLEVLPTVSALRGRAEEIVEQVLRENENKWESASPRDRERIDALARAVVNRLLHDPTLRMKELRDDRVHARMALVRELFALEVDEVAGGEREPSEDEQLAEVRQLRP